MKKKGKLIVSFLLALVLFLSNSFTVMALDHTSETSPYVSFTVDEIPLTNDVLDKEIEFVVHVDQGSGGIPSQTDHDWTAESDVVLLTKEKYDNIKALEKAVQDARAALTAETGTLAELDDAIEALEQAIDVECQNFRNAYPTITTTQLNWVDCEQESYILVVAKVTDYQGTISYGYITQPFTNPEICEEEVVETNPKTGIESPIILGGIATLAATALLLSRKKRYI